MTDFFDDYDDFDDGDFIDGEPDEYNDGMDADDELSQQEIEADSESGLDWEDIAFLGGMAEEIAQERRQVRRRRTKHRF